MTLSKTDGAKALAMWSNLGRTHLRSKSGKRHRDSSQSVSPPLSRIALGAQSGPMSDEAPLLRRKAEACRQLADTAEDESRRGLWIERARHWEQLAAKTANQPKQQESPGV
jgi:hypothetical protein